MRNGRFQRGQKVKVRVFGGQHVYRRVVFEKGPVIAVCCEDEWQAAARDDREPTCIGFRSEAVSLTRKGFNPS